MSDYQSISARIRALGSPVRARAQMRFFKTKKGSYGAHDVFLGLNVPEQRAIAKEFSGLHEADIIRLLAAKEHEFRLTALFILVARFIKGDEKTKGHIYRLYLRHRRRVNNWDLVDASAGSIVGGYLSLYPNDRTELTRLARSDNLWDRRIAIVSTHGLIRRGELGETYRIARTLLRDKEDLIHKATGWMLREAGKKDEGRLRRFLNSCASRMPRTTLRYTIERFPEKERQAILSMEKRSGRAKR